MTKEKLLIPRYKVIATYPFNDHFMLNENIELNEYDNRSHLDPEYYVIKQPLNRHGTVLPLTMYETTFKQYPHLFKKLQWWEERQIEDMPKYVRYSEYYLNHYHLDGDYKKRIFKVDNWIKGHYGFRATAEEIIHGYEMNFIPATEEEYNQFKQRPTP